MKRRDEFSSFETADALGIPIERMRQWMKLGFITPTKPAEGQGTKAIFTRGDVYRTALFIHLIEMGFNRKTAAFFTNAMLADELLPVFMKKRQEGEKTINLIIIKRAGDKKDYAYLKSGCHVAVEELAVDTETGEPHKWTSSIIMNILQIIDEIDARLPE